MGPKEMAPKKKAVQRRGQKTTRKAPPKPSQPQQRLKNIANQKVSKAVGRSGVKTRAMLRREQEEAAKENEQNSVVSDMADTQPDGEQDADVSDQVVNQAENRQSEASAGGSVASTTTSEAVEAIDHLERQLELTETKLSAAKDDWLELKKYLGRRMFPKDPGVAPDEFDENGLAGMIEAKLFKFLEPGSRKWRISGAYWDLDRAVYRGELRRAKLQVQLRRKRARTTATDAHRIPEPSAADVDTDTNTDEEDEEDSLSNSSITRGVLERLRDGTLDQLMNAEISDKGSEVSVDGNEVLSDNDAEKARERYLAARRGLEDAQKQLGQSWLPIAYPI